MLTLRRDWRDIQLDVHKDLPANYHKDSPYKLLESLPLLPGETRLSFPTEESRLKRLSEFARRFGTEIRQVRATWKWAPGPMPNWADDEAWWGFTPATGRWTRERTPDRRTVDHSSSSHRLGEIYTEPLRGAALRAPAEDGKGHFYKQIQ